MLLDPIPYSESKSLSLHQHFFHLVYCYLIAFLSLSIFLLNYAKDYFMGLGFLLPFLAAQKSGFSIPSFSYLRQSLVLSVVYVPPGFLQSLQCFLVQAFLGTLPMYMVPGLLFPFSPLWKTFLLDCALNLSWVHMCSIALRDKRNKCMSMGVTPFLCRLNWSCNGCGHIKRMWLTRSALAKVYVHGNHTGLGAQAVVLARQLCNVEVELFYMPNKLT